MQWRSFFAAGQRALPRDATPQDRAARTRELAAEWRAGHKSPSRYSRRSRPNPISLPTVARPPSSKLLTLGLIGVAVYVGVRALGQRQPAPMPAAQEPAMGAQVMAGPAPLRR